LVTKDINIQGAAPIAAFKPSANQGCIPFTVQFSDQSAGDPTAWAWTFPGGNPVSSTAQNPTVTYSTPGQYSVTLEVTNAFGSNTSTQTNAIEALALPMANFTSAATDLSVQFTNQSQFGTSYTWNFGDNSTSNEPNPVHTYAAPGEYTVSLTVLNNCGATTLQKMITLTSGAGEVTWLNTFRLYPNPNTGAFTVEMNGEAAQELEFSMVDALGQLVNRQVVEFGTGTLTRNFDYNHLPAGFYTLQIHNGSSALQVKVAIQR
jgi:PKD repeat protein